jgi:hypothetical protein
MCAWLAGHVVGASPACAVGLTNGDKAPQLPREVMKIIVQRGECVLARSAGTPVKSPAAAAVRNDCADGDGHVKQFSRDGAAKFTQKDLPCAQ